MPLATERRQCAAGAFVFLLALSVGTSSIVRAQSTSDSARAFGRVVEQLSEPGGYFNTDNLISNERSYLHVLSAFDRLGVHGGAYIGVGPDQNFSYIARIRPTIAFVIDIRRDNLLQHLMFKALFACARNRLEYLALLLGRPTPATIDRWNEQSIESIIAVIDTSTTTAQSASAARASVLAFVQRSGVALSANDMATIKRFHNEFIAGGLGLQFTTTGRAPQYYYPTLRQLLLERDLDGQTSSYLAHEADFQFVKSLEARNLIIPVVGDLSGAHALSSIGLLIAQRGERVSALYASNAEDYLLRDGTFPRYARTVTLLPRDAKSVIIRSYFGGEGSHPESVTGYYSTQLLQTINSFSGDVANGGIISYRQLVQQHFIPLRP